MSARVLVVALVFTLLNVGKPVTIDDPTYLHYAAHIARAPLDPYGTQWFWYEQPEEANAILAPAVFLYYLAGVLTLVGDNLVLVKLALFPWAWLLAFAFDRLLTRFAPTVRTPFLIGAVLSPALVPGFNLMLDVPALALSLATVVLYLHALDRNALTLAALAGVVLGLAMQTKYTAFVVPGVLLWATLLQRRWLLWPVAVGVGVGLFVAWELYLAALYGRSHFVISASGQGGLLGRAVQMAPFFLTYLGGLGCIWLLVGLWVLPVRRWVVWATAGGVVGVHLLILLLDARFTNDTRLSPLLFGPTEGLREVIQLAEPLFTVLGVAVLVVLVVLVWIGWRLVGAERSPAVFLLGWLALELGGLLVLSPFAAARRLYGFLAVVPLLLAAQAERTRPGRAGLGVLIAAQVVLAVGYGALDHCGAWTHQAGVERAAAYIAAQGGEGRVWYVGHWGWQYYADRAGMSPLVARSATPSQVRAGDWLVFPDTRVEQQQVTLAADEVELRHEVSIAHFVPLRTLWCFHWGRTPLEHCEGTALEVRVYRARRDFEPQSGAPEAFHRGY